jgi:hypothetical protein
VAQVLSVFWVSGDLRTNDNLGGLGRHFGSIPGSTTLVLQRRDGVNLVALFNNRREKSFTDDNKVLQELFDEALVAAIKP